MADELTRTAQVALNTLTSYIRFAIALIVLFLLTPFMISSVGNEDFGLWSLVFSVLSFFGLLDLGFGPGVVKWVAECRGSRDIERRNRILSTVSVAYVLFALVATAGIGALSLCFNWLFSIPQAQHDKALVLLWILAVRSVVLNLPLSMFYGVLFGEQKVYLTNSVQAGSTLLYGLAAWTALDCGLGLIAVAWISLAAMLVEHLAYIFFAFTYVEGLQISWSLVDRRLFKKATSFSVYVFVTSAVGLIFVRTDPMIVKFFLPLSSVAVYAIALKIAENIHLFTKQFIDALSPLAAEFQGGGEEGKIRFLLINCTKFAFVPAVMLAVSVWIYARELIVFWVGPAFVEAVPVLTVLMGIVIFAIPQMMASNVLMMTGYHRFVAYVAVAGTLLHIAVSVALVRPLGLPGVALGTLISFIVIYSFMTIKKACKVYDVRYRDYLCRAIAPAVLPGMAQLALTCGIKAWLPPTGLGAVGLQALAGVVLYGVVFWRFYVEFGEKQLFAKKLMYWRRQGPAFIPKTEEVCS